MIQPNLVIITGRSGSGKNTAIAALEDLGFYCVDNMPVALLPDFLDHVRTEKHQKAAFAFVMDLREKGFLANFQKIINKLKKKAYPIEIIFLDADDKTLLQRFKQTRRPHPFGNGLPLMENIRQEAVLMAPLKDVADRVIDTSAYTVHDLKFLIHKIAKEHSTLTTMAIQVKSFGFKFGIPLDADLIIDVRFLANPYFIAELKPLDGNSEKIRSFVLNNKETNLFLQKYLDLLDYLIPLYEKEGKAYLTIAVGCTGGRHRSVVIANTISEHIRQMHNKSKSNVNKQITITHRDIGHAS